MTKVTEIPRVSKAATSDWRVLPCFQSVSFVVDMRQRERFRSWKLIDEWNGAYVELFDPQDLKILKNPSNGHQVTRGFCEYLAAVLIFHATGWRSLVRNYEAKNHPLKSTLFRKIVGDEVFHIVHGMGGAPDLFVFGPDAEAKKEWFFAEIKGPGDKIRKNQIDVAQQLFEITKKSTLVVELKEI